MLEDGSGTATEDEEDVRARELRKQEVWLKVPPRNSDTDTGSETEVKHSQDSIDPAIAQESFISFESKVTPSLMSNVNTNDSEPSSNKNALGELLEFSNETTLASNELVKSTHDQNSITSAHKNDASFNVTSQVSENVICAIDSMPLPVPNNDNNISDQNESLILLTDIALNHLDKEDCNSEYESFVDENTRLDLNGSDNKIDDDYLQNDILSIDMKNLTSNSINFDVNVNNLSTNILVNSLDLSTNNLEKDSVQYNRLEVGSKEVAKITVADTIPCIGTSEDSKVSNSETILNVDDLPGVISSSLKGRNNSLSSSSSEIYQSVEMLYSDNAIITDHSDDLVEYSKSNLPEETKIFKYENINVTNQSEGNDFINKNRDIKFINDNNVIHVCNITDKKIDVHSTPMLTTNILQKSVYPVVTVTSPSPTQEIQVEELSLETSKLLVPLDSCSIPNFDTCNNSFDKLKRDLKQRKEKNKVVGNGLRPLSTEYARLKMSKYFMENKKMIPKSQSTQIKEAEDTSNTEIVKLHIKPKLSNKVNAEEMLKYFNKSSSNKNKSKTSDLITMEQNERQKLEIDIEEISDLSEKDIDAIDQQFNQIEEQNESTYLKADEIGYLSRFEIHNDKEETACNNLDLICNNSVELHPQSSIDNNYVDPLMSNCNISKLEDNERNLPYLHIDTNVDMDLNINNFNYDDIIKTNIQSNILNNAINKEKRANSMDFDGIILNNSDEKQATKINIPYDDLNKDNKSNKNLLFGHNIPLNAKSTTSFLLNNNTDKVIKCNRLHKSDTNLNEDKPRVFCKNISNNTSKSLSELKNLIYQNVSAIESTIVEKIIGSSINVKDTITNNNSVKNCVEEVQKESEQKNLSYDINSVRKTPTTIPNLTISNTELFPPEVPIRKKSAKRGFKDLHQNQVIENMSKVQNQTIDNISKLYQNSNNVSNIQKQDAEKLTKIECQDDEDVRKLISQDVNNIPKIHGQNVENHDTNSTDIQRPPRRNITKLQSRDITNVNKEIIKDIKDVIITENQNVPGTSRLQNQGKNVSSTQESYHYTNLNLQNKSKESTKFISDNSQSKKDKCIIS